MYIKLTTPDDQPLYVNSGGIITLAHCGTGSGVFLKGFVQTIRVKESPADIIRRLQEDVV